ncbi:MAG: SPOR domain-containing protein [Thermodesulfobacteriota bacterium]|jgi:cell division septation protein DedD
MKDKEISEEELLDELDTMYQRVADIEKEEAAVEAPPPLMIKPIKPKQKKKRSYRTLIIMASVFLIILASIFTITIFDPMNLLRRLKMGEPQPSTVATPPAYPKRSTAVPSPAAPKPPAVVTSQEPPKPPAVATSSAAPPSPSVAPSPTVSPRLPSGSPPVQTKQEAVKRTQEEAEKATSKPQEIVRPNKPAPRGRYYAIQVGAFRDMENVRELVEAFKKEGLEAYWITTKSTGSGSLHRVLVGQFTDENEAAQFLKDKKILKNYPESFVKEVSSSKMNR